MNESGSDRLANLAIRTGTYREATKIGPETKALRSNLKPAIFQIYAAGLR
jgi:hypothetical protein